MITLSFEQKEDIGLKYVQDRLETVSPFGAKTLKNEGFYGPERQAALERELNNVALLAAALEREGYAIGLLRHDISCLKDLSGSLSRCENESLSEVELFELNAFCLRLKDLIPRIRALPGYEELDGVRLTEPDGPLAVLDPAGRSRLSFYVEDTRTPALASARREKKELERRIRETEGPKEALLRKRQDAVRREEDALAEIYGQMSRGLRPYLAELAENGAAIGRLDAGLAKALLVRRYGLTRPSMGGEELILTNAVHPAVAEALAARGRSFTPISIGLPKGVTVLTGANMGGKSIALKTVLLNAALALSGCFVFCEAAEVPMFSRLELINRDFSDDSQGLSSFGGEILRFNEAAARLSEGGLSLIIMDEFAKGTNVREGEAIARGAVRYLNDKNAVTLFATHYDGTADGAAAHYQAKGLTRLAENAAPAASGRDGLRVIENVMEYGVIPVETDAECPRDAFKICRLLGLPEEILEPPENDPDRA